MGLQIWITHNNFQQIAPIVVLFLVPTLVLFAASWIRSRLGSARRTTMSVRSWLLSWTSQPVSPSKHTREKNKTKNIRTRSGRLQANGTATELKELEDDEGYYPGLVNISGTYCFMNSTLQALASLSYLQPHIEAIHTKAELLDVPTPVLDALKTLLSELNTPHSSYRALRPLDIIEVLGKQTEGRANSLFHSREHQDAQELFQLVSECIKNETAAVDKESARDRGFGGLAQISGVNKEIGKSVFDGLTANRRSCVICGYTEAVMHFAFDNWQLSVPRLAATCRLEDCLEDYTRLEILKDCICRKCSMVATHSRLQKELEALQETQNPSNSKKKRLKEVKKMETRVREMLQQGRIEDDVKNVRIEKAFSPASTKQAMIARPPPVLALHLNRSIHYGHYATKNNCRVVFPEVLDLTPYTTSGSLSTVPTAAISTPPPAVPRSTTPTPSIYGTPRTMYRLSAVVCHYGSHSFGHYVCYRRKPRGRFLPPKLVEPKDDEGSILWEDGEPAAGTGWLRISDDSVSECGIETVLTEGPGVFMLYYELAVRERPSLAANMRASEETLKPEMKMLDLNGSVASLVSEVGVGIRGGRIASSVGLGQNLSVSSIGASPRVVRSVAAGRGRSASAQPSEKRASSVSSLRVTQVLNGSVVSSDPLSASLVKTKSPKKMRVAPTPTLPQKTPVSVEPLILSPHPVHPPSPVRIDA